MSSIPARRTRFIEMLARTAHVVASARAVGVSRPHVYWLRARDADFARRWKEALEGALDSVETEARRRAVEGWDEPVLYQGAQVGAIRRYSDGLPIALLKAHRPEMYRDRYRVEDDGCDNLMEELEKGRARVEAGRRADREQEEVERGQGCGDEADQRVGP